jgi:CPA1 family monovalent cation:H+ antiporter
MSIFQTVALLLTLAAVGAFVNQRVFKLPATIGLMVFALLMSLLVIGLNHIGLLDLAPANAFVAHIDFSNILLHGMLSFLLFAGALHINLTDLKKHRAIVAILATVGVVMAAFIAGYIIWWASAWLGFSLPFIYALLFGTLIAPTDPVAVLGILQQTNISKNLRVKIGCESLLNDGVGVVLFVLVLNLAIKPTQSITTTDILFLLLWEGVASVILGLTLGWMTYKLLEGVDDYKVEVLLTLSLVTGGYSLAEIAHVSAPITMVVAGLVIGNHGAVFGSTHKTRRHVDLFWELLDDILNTVLFMLMGLQMVVIPFNTQHLVMGLAAIIAMLTARFISVAIPVSLMRLRYRFEKGTIILLTWGGLRGGISIALALSLPNGPERDIIIGMTYLAVVFSVLFQGTTFHYVVDAITKKQESSR